MIEGADEHVAAMPLAGARVPDDSEVVGLRGSGGEDDAVRLRARGPSDTAAGLIEGLRRSDTCGVA